MSPFDIVGLSAIWFVTGLRIGWLLRDYRQFVQRIEKERRR